MKKYIVALMMIVISFNMQVIGATQEEIDKACDTALGYLGFTADSHLSEDIINDAVKEKKDKILNELKNDPMASDQEIATSFYEAESQLDNIEKALIFILGYYSGLRSYNFEDAVDSLLYESKYLDPKYYDSYNSSVMSKNSLSDAERFAEENFRKNMIEAMRSDVTAVQERMDREREANL